MIRRFIGIAALAAAVALPAVAQAQGVPGGIERAREKAKEPPVLSAPWSAVSLAAWSVASTACWASISVPAFTAMSSSSIARPINIARMSGSAPFCRRKASPITTCRRNMASRDYRYTVVNGRTVLVDPRTHRIVEVVE